MNGSIPQVGNWPLFQPGPVVITPGALDLLHGSHGLARDYLVRHLSGDGGKIGSWAAVEVTPEEWQKGALATGDDAKLNRIALTEGGRILSSYDVDGEKLWIITDAVNSEDAYTTIMLPSDY